MAQFLILFTGPQTLENARLIGDKVVVLRLERYFKQDATLPISASSVSCIHGAQIPICDQALDSVECFAGTHGKGCEPICRNPIRPIFDAYAGLFPETHQLFEGRVRSLDLAGPLISIGVKRFRHMSKSSPGGLKHLRPRSRQVPKDLFSRTRFSEQGAQVVQFGIFHSYSPTSPDSVQLTLSMVLYIHYLGVIVKNFNEIYAVVSNLIASLLLSHLKRRVVRLIITMLSVII